STVAATSPGTRGAGRTAAATAPGTRGAGRTAAATAPSTRGARRAAAATAPSTRGTGRTAAATAPSTRAAGRSAAATAPRGRRRAHLPLRPASRRRCPRRADREQLIEPSKILQAGFRRVLLTFIDDRAEILRPRHHVLHDGPGLRQRI